MAFWERRETELAEQHDQPSSKGLRLSWLTAYVLHCAGLYTRRSVSVSAESTCAAFHTPNHQQAGYQPGINPDLPSKFDLQLLAAMHEQIMGLVRGMFAAIGRKDLEQVNSILAEAKAAGLRQLLFESTDHRGMSPLHAAADCSDSQLLVILVSAGAPVDAASADGSTALVLAALAGDVDSVMVLLSNGAAVDAVATLASTAAELEYCAVIAAISGGSAEVLQQLLAAVQLPPSTSDYAVIWTVLQGHKHLLQQLFDAGADRVAALCHAAFTSNMPDVKSASALIIMQDLLAAGVPVDSVYKDGHTALMSAAMAGSVQAAQVLLAAGAAVGARDSQGRTALHHVADQPGPLARESRAELVRLLIQAGVPASLAEFRNDLQQGRGSPLDCAAAMGHTAVVQELCRHLSADGTVAVAELQDVLVPALRAAVTSPDHSQGRAGVTQVLLDAGADAFWRPKPGSHATVFNFAAVLASPAILDYLLQHGSKQPEVLTAAVMLDAAVLAGADRVPGVQGPPPSTQRQKAMMLVQAAVEHTDSASIYIALQPAAAAASSLVGEHNECSYFWPRLQGHFAQVMFSTLRDMEAELASLNKQQPVVQQTCVRVAQVLAAHQVTAVPQ